MRNIWTKAVCLEKAAIVKGKLNGATPKGAIDREGRNEQNCRASHNDHQILTKAIDGNR